MKAGLSLLIALLTAGAVAGCATPTEQDLRLAGRGREQVGRVLDGFALAVRSKSAGRLRGLFSPSFPPSRCMKLAVRLEQASWLERYRGYTADVEAAVADLGMKNWKSGRILLELAGSNGLGQNIEDRVELVKASGQWWLADFELVQPVEGDLLDPPEHVKARVQQQVVPIMKSLGEGHIGPVYYSLPDKPECHYRVPKLSFLQRLVDRATPVFVYHDLQRLKELDFISWPNPSDPLEFVHVASGAIAVRYEIPHGWPGAEPAEPEYLRLDLVFVRQREDWMLYRIGMSGTAIPYS